MYTENTAALAILRADETDRCMGREENTDWSKKKIENKLGF